MQNLTKLGKKKKEKKTLKLPCNKHVLYALHETPTQTNFILSLYPSCLYHIVPDVDQSMDE